ncbi:hypothetical protein J4437_07425 [Candidatus Woesearchaeota archaeon]|nr:hypothetical protein [uncultured archaeon]MBS3124429.1 hypothetical protein [Candidatus Woesearchaeota archaeon]
MTIITTTIKTNSIFSIPYYWKTLVYTLATIFALLPLFFNLIKKEPLFNGGETYALLSFLHLQNIPLYFLAPLPIILMFFTIYFLINLAKQFNISTELTFYSLIFFIISPTFINTYSTISAASIFLFLILVCFYIYNHYFSKTNNIESSVWSYILIMLLISASFFDWISSIFVLGFLLYLYLNSNLLTFRSNLSTPTSNLSNLTSRIFNFRFLVLGAILIIFVLNLFIFHRPLFFGPFHQENILSDLISDFGGISGLSFFALFLFFIGLGSTWKTVYQKKTILFAYLSLLILSFSYYFYTEIILYLTIVIVFFAAQGFIELLKQKWVLSYLKGFTIFLLLLSLFFSTTTYLQRNYHYGPSSSETEVLLWTKENISPESIIFSEPINSPFVNYFTQKETFSSLNDDNYIKKRTTINLFNSTYTSESFPLFEQNNITHIYITPSIKEKYPAQQGLLFLLKNEKFKMLYSNKDYELWSFTK